jgi:hypothetical protein
MEGHTQYQTRAVRDPLDAMLDRLQAIGTAYLDQPVARAEQQRVAQTGSDCSAPCLLAFRHIAE